MKHLLTALTLAAMASTAQAGNLESVPAAPVVVADESLSNAGGLSAGAVAGAVAGLAALALLANDDDSVSTTTTTTTN
ncbi:hypothetical protein [Leisingera daeponensis]|uniref:hypothetical protein n=1 Tax=Leisingera daeponensis TaxID=405746 RepID=UPI001C968380|nr:hypothetical protein [Leisingera daeponensis]MBY6059181.1 hypothetical protein [Leisingera daeponensis]